MYLFINFNIILIHLYLIRILIANEYNIILSYFNNYSVNFY
jgi:hypothetical protein